MSRNPGIRCRLCGHLRSIHREKNWRPEEEVIANKRPIIILAYNFAHCYLHSWTLILDERNAKSRCRDPLQETRKGRIGKL